MTDAELLYERKSSSYVDATLKLKEIKKRPKVLHTMLALVGIEDDILVAKPLGHISFEYTPIAQMTDSEVASFFVSVGVDASEKIQRHQKEYAKRFDGKKLGYGVFY